MKVFFNTKAFDVLDIKKKLHVTSNPEEAELAVLGAKSIDFNLFPRLRAIYRFGVGRENIPQSIIDDGKLKVVFPSEKTRNILFESTANFTVYLIFYMLFKDVVGNVDIWEKHTRKMISSKKCLVIGGGNIGSRVAIKLRPFMPVEIFDIKYNRLQELKSMISGADVISLHIPLNDTTNGFIDREKLSWMKDNVLLINTARGALVDEEALFNRFINSNISAAFDVFWEEPYNGKMKQFFPDRFFMTPHTSSQCLEYVSAGFEDILSLISELGGRTL